MSNSSLKRSTSVDTHLHNWVSIVRGDFVSTPYGIGEVSKFAVGRATVTFRKSGIIGYFCDPRFLSKTVQTTFGRGVIVGGEGCGGIACTYEVHVSGYPRMYLPESKISVSFPRRVPMPPPHQRQGRSKSGKSNASKKGRRRETPTRAAKRSRVDNARSQT